ncbi:hypothetical protein AB0467_28145 [Streptomyces sp. NPDC052095]|uniref:hypothetical protein n=1 Tax=unclassified Streptomyces TaxID=2593676 RepID=UPI00344DDD89
MPIMELTDLDNLIDELDERITGSDLPGTQGYDSLLICDSTLCGSAICGSAINC